MEIKILSDKNSYNNFLIGSKHKDILQSWEWGEVKSNFSWIPHRIGFYKNDKLVGICQILERNLPLGFKLLYVPRGPVINWDDKQSTSEVLNDLREFINRSYENKRVLFLRLEPPVLKSQALDETLERNRFKKYFKTIQPPATLLINLNRTEEELLKSFRRTARNLIHRSAREGMVVEPLASFSETAEHLKGFYNLYSETGQRFSFPLRPYKQFESLVKEMSGSDSLRLYIAKIKGLILAYGMVLLLGDRAFYIWGGTGRHEQFSRFFNYGYIWGILRDLKSIGIKTFDFWGLGPLENKKHPWYGFSLFKTAFDGTRFEYAGAFDLSLSRFYSLFKLADRIITPRYRATSS